MEGRREKNGDDTITPSSSMLPLVAKKFKIKPGFIFGVSFVLIFICVITFVTTYHYAVQILGTKTIFGHSHKEKMNTKKQLTNIQNLCSMHSPPYDCPQKTTSPYPTDFKRLYKDLVPAHQRFLKKLLARQNESYLQTAQG